ncbi:hypothetical protein N0V86_005884 [Didymella sp. IMI 355093]|nr:hypothetical protein N0V86_005884 [Didymella sp. IMI 355093]
MQTQVNINGSGNIKARAGVNSFVDASGAINASQPDNYGSAITSLIRSLSMSEYPSAENLNSMAGVGSVKNSTNFGEYADFRESFATNAAASVSGVTNGLTGLETPRFANMPHVVDSSPGGNCPTVSANGTSDVH